MQARLAKPAAVNTDFEVRSLDVLPVTEVRQEGWLAYFKYLFFGGVFGVVLIKSEVTSWFRIQEMFRLQSFHLYGIIGSAVVTGIVSVWLIKKFKMKTMRGETIVLPSKKFTKGQIYGGVIFGFGWAVTGACPGPLFAQIGSGFSVVIITLLSAVAGTWLYGFFKQRLPH